MSAIGEDVASAAAPAMAPAAAAAARLEHARAANRVRRARAVSTGMAGAVVTASPTRSPSDVPVPIREV